MADAGWTKRSKVANMRMPDHVPKQERPPVRHIGRWGWAGVDGLAWIACVILAIWLRFDFNIPSAVSTSMFAVALAAALVQLFVGAFAGPYAIGHERGSFEEVVDVGRVAVITAAIVFAALLVLRPVGFPRTTPFTAGAFALGSMLALRFVLRAWRQSHVVAREGGKRVIVFGAGEAGRQLLRAMGRTSDAGLAAVAILDDDPQKARLRVEGVRVRGTREALGAVAAQTGADTLVIALPSADAALIRDLRARADGAGLDVLVLPPISEILGGRPTTTDLRDIDLTDLLGRRPVSLDTRAIAEHIAGRTVLVTGAGGSIGSELCRQLARFGPGSLHLLDRDESGLQATQLSLTGSGLLDSDEIILADIRDLGSLRAAFVKASPTSSSMQRRSSTCRSSRPTPSKHGRATCWAPSTSWCCRRGGCEDLCQHLHGQGRRPHLRSGIQQAGGRAHHRRFRPPRARPLCRCASATSSARADPSSTCSPLRSSEVGR